jgi:ssDNA-binding Zn-finger/Zn-ribbon topoisomerase 1
MDRIQQAIKNDEKLILNWICTDCHHDHSINLSETAKYVETEYHLGSCRPDVVSLDSDNNPLGIFEIVVTHRPEAHVLEYGSSRNIPVIEFHIKSAAALEHLGKTKKDGSYQSLRAKHVHFCTREKCTQCGNGMQTKELHIVEGGCWSCGKTMKLEIIDVEGYIFGPDDFSEEEMQLARDNGVYLNMQYSNTQQRSYLANTCPSCGNFAGNFYLREYSEHIHDGTGLPLGNVCLRCRFDETRQ